MAGRIADLKGITTARAGTFAVRPASLRDLLALHALQRRCFSGSQAYGLLTLLVLHLWPRACILVACAGDRIAGCVVGDVYGGQARILNLCVDPEFRRQGIGRRLLTLAEDVLGAADVTLMVEDKNTGAQELYRRCGYLPVSDLRHYYGKNRHGILMQKRRAADG